MDDATHTITQKRFLRGSQQLTIKGHVLKIERRRGLSLEQQCFDLRTFEPEPLRIKHVPLGRMLVSLIAFGVAATLLTWAIRTSNNNAFVTAMLLGLLFTFVTFIMSIQTCIGFANVVVFQDTFRQIRLWHDRPDKVTFEEFVSTLSAQIRKARDREHSLLQRLRKANLITDQQYDRAVEFARHESNHP